MVDGRTLRGRKLRVDEVKYFEIKYLMHVGVLKKKDFDMHVCEWKRGGKTHGSFCYQMYYDKAGEPEFIRFSYTITNKDKGDKQSYDYLVRLTATPCNFGGKRWWFICSLAKNGTPCGRRCSILYLPGGYAYFGCRSCYELTYESRQRHRNRYYEEFLIPIGHWKEELEKLKKARSLKEKSKVLKKIQRYKRIVNNYNDDLDRKIQKLKVKYDN